VFTILPQYHRVVDNNSCKMHFVQLLSLFVVSLLVLAVEGQTVSRRPTIGTLAGSQLRRNSFLTARVTRKLRHLQRSIITNGGCNVKMCFALDGSGSISRAEYRLQQEFVQIIAAVASVDGAASFSAVQYGLRNVGISSLTSDIGDFITSVGTSELEKAPRTFVAAGLGFCIQEVRSSNDTDSTGNGGHVAIQGPSKIVYEVMDRPTSALFLFRSQTSLIHWKIVASAPLALGFQMYELCGISLVEILGMCLLSIATLI